MNYVVGKDVMGLIINDKQDSFHNPLSRCNTTPYRYGVTKLLLFDISQNKQEKTSLIHQGVIYLSPDLCAFVEYPNNRIRLLLPFTLAEAEMPINRQC